MNHSADDVRQARIPIASLLAKSEKAQQKLAPETWQHSMLKANIFALRVADSLMSPDTVDRDYSTADLSTALDALSSLIQRTEDSKAKFAEGTSQHSLQRNRLDALHIARDLVRAKAEGDLTPGA